MTEKNEDLSQYFIDSASADNEDQKHFRVHGCGEVSPEEDDDDYELELNADLNKEEILVMLAAWECEHLETYKKFFAVYGVRIISVENEEEFLGFARVFPINGVVADHSSFSTCSEDTKNLLVELESHYPFLRTGYNPETNTFECFYYDHSIKTIEDFIEEKCRHFSARTLRSNSRHPISLNVEISPEKEFLRVEKTVTLDISSNGLFVLAMSPMWEGKQKCYISIKEFNSESLIECNVMRQVKWGEKSFKNPGIGVQIVSIHESLQEDFQMLLEKWRLG
jgi:hypothetical protein